jgi:hypothetical protein
LQPLSRDHHNVLVHARRLRGLDARFDAPTARRRFLSYLPVLLLHFDEEERILLPHVKDAALGRRLRDEHIDLRRRAAHLASSSDGQADLGEALRLHVRFEEDLLFPHLEAAVGEAILGDLAQAGVAYRAKERPESLTGGEACFL